VLDPIGINYSCRRAGFPCAALTECRPVDGRAELWGVNLRKGVAIDPSGGATRLRRGTRQGLRRRCRCGDSAGPVELALRVLRRVGLWGGAAVIAAMVSAIDYFAKLWRRGGGTVSRSAAERAVALARQKGTLVRQTKRADRQGGGHRPGRRRDGGSGC